MLKAVCYTRPSNINPCSFLSIANRAYRTYGALCGRRPSRRRWKEQNWILTNIRKVMKDCGTESEQKNVQSQIDKSSFFSKVSGRMSVLSKTWSKILNGRNLFLQSAFMMVKRSLDTEKSSFDLKPQDEVERNGSKYEDAFNALLIAFSEQSKEQENDKEIVCSSNPVHEHTLHSPFSNCPTLQQEQLNELTIVYEETINKSLEATNEDTYTAVVLISGLIKESRYRQHICFPFGGSLMRIRRFFDESYWKTRKILRQKTDAVYKDILDKLFSVDEQEMMRMIIKERLNEQISRDNEFQDKKRHTKRENADEAAKEILKNIIRGVMKTEFMKIKVTTIFDSLKDKNTQRKFLERFIWIVLKYVIGKEIVEFINNIKNKDWPS
jgi:hypothetical protein